MPPTPNTAFAHFDKDTRTENLPAIVVEELPVLTARLPAAYKAAQVALANCVEIDECKSWADKAQALASYARQADDETLHKHATRIQSRAVRRCGELLSEFDARGGDRKSEEIKSNGGVTFDPDREPSRREIADQAGLSVRQERTAVRVANVPEEIFEAAVESDAPPTVTALADMGRKARPEAPMTPEQYAANIHLKGHTWRFAEFCDKQSPAVMAGAVADHYTKEIRREVAKIRRWLKAFSAAMRSEAHEL